MPPVPRHIKPRRLEDSITEYLEYLRSTCDWAQSTIRNAQSGLRHFQRFANNPMTYNVDRNMVSRYIVDRRQGLATSSLNQCKTHVRMFLKWCEEEHYLENAVLVARDLRNQREHRVERRRLTADQFDRLHDAGRTSRDRMVLVLLTETLMRSSEAQGLVWGGIGLQTGEVEFMRWKTGQMDVLPISMLLDRELRRYQVWYAAKIGRPVRPEDYVVCSATTCAGIPKSDDTITLHPDRPMGAPHVIVQAALDEVGWEGLRGRRGQLLQEGGHTLRRSAARELLEALFNDPDLKQDEALLMVMTMLGHASMDMTMRYVGYDRDKDKVMRLLKGRDWWAYARGADVIPISRATAELR